MLTAYVDDSFGHAGDSMLYLAAYIQTVDVWSKFQDEWDSVLRSEPKIDYFKMAEANQRRQQFRGFSVAKRNKKVFELANVVKKYHPWGVHTCVSIPAFNQYVKPYAPFPMATPYFILMFAILFGVARIHNKLGIIEPCRFVFDRQEGMAAKIAPIFEGMFEMAPDGWRELVVGTPTFEDDTVVLPLQAADMLAWHVRRADEGNYPSEYDGILDMITVDGVHHFSDISINALQKMGEGFSV